MDTSNKKMKWILFWVFVTPFIMAVLGTLSVVFLGFGSPTDTEREWLVKGLLFEVSACVIALFYSIFELKKSNVSLDKSFVSDFEKRLEELETKLLLSAEEIDRYKSLSMEKDDLDSPSSNSSFMHEMYPFLAAIDGITAPSAFDENIYNTYPSYPDIIDDIEKVKPFDKEHRLKSYIGLKVQWKCAFSSFSEDDNFYRIRVHTEKPLYSAYLNIDKSKDVSKLKVLDEHHPLWICGEISKINGVNIELVNADISVQ